MPVPSPYAPEHIARWVTFPRGEGRVSHFGGPTDRGVTASETMSVVANAGAGRELCRNPNDPHYIACRWGYVTETLKANGAPVKQVCQELLRQRVLVTYQGRGYVCQPRDWGPNIRTRREADISPQAIGHLGAKTDATVSLFWVPPTTPLGPLDPAQVARLAQGQPPQTMAGQPAGEANTVWVTPGNIDPLPLAVAGASLPAGQIYGANQITIPGFADQIDVMAATLERTIDGADTLTVQLIDPTRAALRAGVADKAHLVTIDGQTFALDGIRKNGADLTLTLPVDTAKTLMTTKPEAPIGQQPGVGTRAQFIAHLARMVGVKIVTVPDAEPTKQALSTNPGETLWEATGRLAGEVDWRRFIVGDTLVVGPDSWLASRPPIRWREHTRGVETIDFDLVAGEPAAKATVTCDLSLWQVQPGMPVELSGVGPADGIWLIDSVGRSLSSVEAAVHLTRVQPALPEPDAEPQGGFSDAGRAGPGNGVIGPMGAGEPPHIQAARTQLGMPYLWGGQRSDGQAGRWRLDCSGLVQWAFKNAYGLAVPRVSGDQRNYFAQHGTKISIDQARQVAGAVLWKRGHVAMSIGDGQQIEQPRTGLSCRIAPMGDRFTEAYWPAK